MRIAVPLDEKKEKVCVSFGRAPYMLFADTEKGTQEVMNNPAAEAHGGAGIKAAQFLVDNQANVLITVRCGENAAEVFQEAEIEIYKASPLTAEENVKQYLAGELEKLTKFHAGFHGIQ